MHTIGRFAGAGRNLDGELTLTFVVDDREIENIESLQDKDLVIDVERYYEKRSLNANRYFWKLCDLIARKLGSSKDTIYLMKLKDYGVWQDVDVVCDALPALEQAFRYVEVLHDGLITDENRIEARCYLGSSHYDKRQMAELINGTVNDAHDLGIDTWTEEEINRLIAAWENK